MGLPVDSLTAAMVGIEPANTAVGAVCSWIHSICMGGGQALTDTHMVWSRRSYQFLLLWTVELSIDALGKKIIHSICVACTILVL